MPYGTELSRKHLSETSIPHEQDKMKKETKIPRYTIFYTNRSYKYDSSILSFSSSQLSNYSKSRSLIDKQIVIRKSPPKIK